MGASAHSGGLAIATLGSIVQENDGPIAQVAADASNDVVDASPGDAVAPADRPADDGEVEVVHDASDDRVRVPNGGDETAPGVCR